MPEIPDYEGRVDKKEDYLPYEMRYLTEAMELVAEKELKETVERKKEALKKFRQLIAEDVKLYTNTEDIFLLRFLRTRKYDVQKAFKTLQNYYKMRQKFSHIYDSESNEIVHNVFRKNFIGFLPYRDKSGSVLCVAKLGMWNPDEVNRDLLMWTITHCMLHSLEDTATQVMGYVVLIDMRGIGFKHFQQLTMENIQLAYNSIQFCLPARIKAIHIIGISRFFSTIWNIIYPFVFSLKLKKKIHIHGEDMTSLHKHLSPAILPSEYGGELGPFDNSDWHAKILSNNEWCLAQRLYGYQS